MDDKRYSVNLRYDELILIDGKCSEDIQKVIDLAKEEHSYGLDPVSNTILAESMKSGKLTWRYIKIRCCKCCEDKPSGYYRYSRSSRYHRKGDLNYDSPFSYSGIEPNGGFVRIDGRSGICSDCWNNIFLPKLVKYIIENDLPIEIQKNDIAQTKYIKDEMYKCFNCECEIYASDMGKNRTLMGDGYYPSECPVCGAKSLPFGASHKTTGKFRMLRIKGDTVNPNHEEKQKPPELCGKRGDRPAM